MQIGKTTGIGVENHHRLAALAHCINIHSNPTHGSVFCLERLENGAEILVPVYGARVDATGDGKNSFTIDRGFFSSPYEPFTVDSYFGAAFNKTDFGDSLMLDFGDSGTVSLIFFRLEESTIDSIGALFPELA